MGFLTSKSFSFSFSYLLKVHCHAIQWFYVDFLRSKMAAGRLEAAALANEKQAFVAPSFFSSPVSSFAINRRRGISQLPCKVTPLSDVDGLWDKIKKVKTKDKFAHEKWGKFMETKAGLRSSTDRAWVVLVRRSFKTCEAFRCSCVYFPTQYNVHYDNRHGQDTCWARYAWNDARPPLFFPTTKWRKKSLNSVTVHL